MNTKRQRQAGVLLHISSLPSQGFTGDFGVEARHFVDFLVGAGVSVWQVLPLGPPHNELSPYAAYSVHAGNTAFIDLAALVHQGLISAERERAGRAGLEQKQRVLGEAATAFFSRIEQAPDSDEAKAYACFVEDEMSWLESYCRYRVLRKAHGDRYWLAWPPALHDCESEAVQLACQRLDKEIRAERFAQFVFYQQWQALRSYANERGVKLFGDMAFFVDIDSADVWANPSQFDLEPSGKPRTVAGVPPDYFAADGQLWGNPQYNWKQMEADGFSWWLARFDSAAVQFDIVRIDHFRALQAFWEIPADAKTARDGRWVEAPGDALLASVTQRYEAMHLVAENLGSIDAPVEALRADHALPGMVVLQFGFDGNPDNPHLLHNHRVADVVYTGTHDNNTSQGWFDSLDDYMRGEVYRYFSSSQEAMPWMLVRQAMSSVCHLAIVPWQDLLGLGEQHRMNVPGVGEGNWRWRFEWQQVSPDLQRQIADLLRLYGRR